jgi:hypothetical protein
MSNRSTSLYGLEAFFDAGRNYTYRFTSGILPAALSRLNERSVGKSADAASKGEICLRGNLDAQSGAAIRWLNARYAKLIRISNANASASCRWCAQQPSRRMHAW